MPNNPRTPDRLASCSRPSIRTRPTDSVTREHAHRPRSARCGRRVRVHQRAAGGTTAASRGQATTSGPEALSVASLTRARDTDAHGARGAGPGVRIYRRMNPPFTPRRSRLGQKVAAANLAAADFWARKCSHLWASASTHVFFRNTTRHCCRQGAARRPPPGARALRALFAALSVQPMHALLAGRGLLDGAAQGGQRAHALLSQLGLPCGAVQQTCAGR